MQKLLRWLPTAIMVVTMVWGGGYSWAKVDANTQTTKAVVERFDALTKTLDERYMSKEVSKAQYESIQQQLGDIKGMLQSVYGSSYGRRFDK